MAIKSFKNIINKNGYLVEEKDRAVFEEGLQKSYFGLGMADEIEFILYDSNDNILPQGEKGKKARYIKLDSANISDYFIITDRNVNTRKTRASEYIVDVERLIREAGYSNGIFKTQVTLLNRRAGSEDREGDKLWIHEISPSRTEIRVLPTRGKKIIEDLEERYKALIDGKQFRDDTIYFVKQLAESVKISDIRRAIITEKGKVSEGERYIKLIQKEFQIRDFDVFLVKLRNLFLEATDYYIAGRISNPNDNRYGKPLGERKIPVDLALRKINETLVSILLQCIDKMLLKRNIQDENILTEEEQITIDKLKEIVRSSYNDDIFSSEGLPEEKAVVGCMDTRALNYNPLAKREDGSCVYQVDEPEIEGCTDATATNYNVEATKDDGSCIYEEGKLLFGQKYYVWSTKASWQWKSENGSIQRGKGVMYDEFSINHYEGTFETLSPQADVRTYPKPRDITSKKYRIDRVTEPGPPAEPMYEPMAFSYYDDSYAGNWFTHQTGGYNNGFDEGLNLGYYGISGQAPVRDRIIDDRIDDGRGRGLVVGLSVSYTNELGVVTETRTLYPGESIEVCARPGSIVLPSSSFTSRLIGDCKDIVRLDDRPIDVDPIDPPRGGGSVGSGGGGGGGSFNDDILFEDQDDYINPFDNPGDRVDRGFRPENFR